VTLVVDASVVVAGLTDNGADGRWAVRTVVRQPGDNSADVASLAHTDLLDLRVEFFPYQPCAARVWEPRDNVTCHDGWYVAVAELLDVPLATLDAPLANSPGPRCQFLLPLAET
jgi:predicted nucleic acid-binding protein